jgi:GTP-binding protein YchF
MKAGITGLPFSGKTALFCALTGQKYEDLSHGKDMLVGTVKVPDTRLERLYEMFQPKKITHAVMEYFDIAGQAGGKGKGMDSQALQTLKNADSLIVVLDAFSENADPMKDFVTVSEDLAFTDLVVVTSRLERIEKDLRSGKVDDLLLEKAVLERCRETLEAGGAIRDLELTEEEGRTIRGYQLLSRKPLLIVVNISEDALLEGKSHLLEGMFADVRNARCAAICARVEMEIAALDETDRPEFLSSMGIEEPALGRVIRMSYASLGLISFFTAGGTDEVRAWTVRKGAKAPECAGVIHSDLERGFIRAETVSFDDLMHTGSFKAAREKGLLRIEGRDYEVQDGDILTIRFSV